MTVLRVSVGVLAVSAALIACGGGNGNGERDSGPGPMDAPMGTDAPSTPTDAPMGTDSGTSSRVCNVAGGACDVIEQNCAMSEGCYFARPSAGAEPTTLCAPAMTGGDGDPCTNVNDCLPGFTCNGGECRRYCCRGASTDCPTGQICIGIGGTEETPGGPAVLGICNALDSCTLAPQTGCDPGQGCYVVASDGSTDCSASNGIAEGMPCEFLNDCAPGFGCYGTGGPATCIGFCRIGMDSDCSAGHACRMVTGVGLPTGIGLCLAR